MSKRVQVTLSDDEWDIVSDLSELRGESMSVVLGKLITPAVLKVWKQEARILRADLAREQRAIDDLHRRLEQLG